MSRNQVRFDSALMPEFSKTLNQRVNDYFSKNKIHKKGNLKMFTKSIVMFAIYLVPYALILTNTVTNSWLVVLLWCVMGVGMAGIGFSIMHDGLHGAYSKWPWLNRIMGFTMNFIGGSDILWKLQHNVLHHTYTNVHGLDEDIDGPPFLRFSPHDKHKKIHKYQHRFFLFAYGLMTIGWVGWKDYFAVARFKKAGLIKEEDYKREFAKILFFKIFYFVYTLGLPIFFFEGALAPLLVGWFLMHYLCSLILSTVFQLAHVMPENAYPTPDEDNVIKNNWMAHQLMTTANFSQKSKIFSWFIGGLNYQVEHHLFSGICHVHYPKLSKIVKQTAEEFKVPYYNNGNFVTAFKQHYQMIKALSKPNAA